MIAPPKVAYDRDVADLHVLRVFAGEDGGWGNPLGVFPAAGEVSAERRQAAAAELGFSETVFVGDAARGALRIHTPTVELPFAGHPTVGAAWLLRHLGTTPRRLQVPAGRLPVRFEGEEPYVAARAEWAPAFEYVRLDSPEGVDGLSTPHSGGSNTYFWAWEDEEAGVIRARCFAPEVGISEDEATGSAALALCSHLGRDILVKQGHGSRISCRMTRSGLIEVGGIVVSEEHRDWRL